MKRPVIFVVDKNPIHRNLVRYYLEINNLKSVQTFPTGEECLYRLRHDLRPDFIVTSYYTGTFDGFDLLGKILGESPDTRVIFFDVFDSPEVAHKLVDAGACDYICKTRNPEQGIAELLKNLRFLIAKQVIQEAY